MSDGRSGRGDGSGERRGRIDVMPIAALVGLVAILLAGWWLVPPVLSALKHQRCVALGSTSC